MGANITSAGLYWGYTTTTTIETQSGLITIVDNGNTEFELNSNDKSTPSRSKVTYYNIDADKINRIHKGDHITIMSGPADLYGVVADGYVMKIESNYDGGKDKATVITLTESVSLKDNTLKANFNGVKTVKTKGKNAKTKLNMTFKGQQKASVLIKKIAAASGISIYHMKLASDKLYKRGYTVSNRPYQAIVKIANDCKSQIYQRRGQLVIDDYSTDNPFNEHIYFEIGSGLLSEPSVYDKQGTKQCYILECFDDPRVQAGSCVQVGSKTLNGLHRVQSVKHMHQNNYVMEVVVYE